MAGGYDKSEARDGDTDAAELFHRYHDDNIALMIRPSPIPRASSVKSTRGEPTALQQGCGRPTTQRPRWMVYWRDWGYTLRESMLPVMLAA